MLLESNVATSIEEYAETHACPQKERFETLVRLLSDNKVPEDTARQFLLEQGLLTFCWNMDRLNNPSNFLLLSHDVTTDTATG